MDTRAKSRRACCSNTAPPYWYDVAHGGVCLSYVWVHCAADQPLGFVATFMESSLGLPDVVIAGIEAWYMQDMCNRGGNAISQARAAVREAQVGMMQAVARSVDSL